MVFHDESKFMAFPLTNSGNNWWRGRRFLTKKEIFLAIDKWGVNPLSNIHLTNIVCDRWGPAVAQEALYGETDLTNLPGDIMDVSLTHGIIHIGRTPRVDNCIAVAESSNHQTNIDADVIESLMRKIKEVDTWR